MKKWIIILSLTIYSQSVIAITATNEELICHPFDRNICKKGDYISTTKIGVIKRCDFNSKIITYTNQQWVTCKYLGHIRSNRNFDPDKFIKEIGVD